MRFYNTTFLTSAFILCALVAQAQSNSPYSRYGIGELQGQDNVANMGMAGVAMGDSSNNTINSANPASYTNLRFTALQFAINGVSNNLSFNNQSKRVGSFNISYINIGVPLNKNSGLSFGLLPYSRVNYGIELEQKNAIDSASIFSQYVGLGSIQNVYAGYAYKYKNFSLGINANFIFGNYSNNTAKVMPSRPEVFLANYQKNKYVNGATFNIGGLYKINLPNNRILNIGATYTPAANLNATRDELFLSSLDPSVTGTGFYDSVNYKTSEKGKIHLPSSTSIGLMLFNTKNTKFGADFTTSNWTQFRDFGAIDSLGNSYKLKLGFTYLPTITTNSKLLNKLEYRAGFYTVNTNVKINGKTITDAGISIGAGLPLRGTRDQDRTFGEVNTALQIGSRGTTANGLIRDNYTRFSVGITLNATWFQKRRYD
jgi:hypothetical protein